MAKLPSVIVLTGDNREIERFLLSLVSNGLVENKLRTYSSSVIDLSILGELVSALQKEREEVKRLIAENERLNTNKEEQVGEINSLIATIEKMRDDTKKEIGDLKDKLREAEGALRAAKSANALFENDINRLKNMLSRCAGETSIIVDAKLSKEIAALLAEV